jgi:hypothetical protein
MARPERIPQDVLARGRGVDFGSVGEAADDGHAGKVGVGGCCEGFCEAVYEGFRGWVEGDGTVGEGTEEGAEEERADGHVGLLWGG